MITVMISKLIIHYTSSNVSNYEAFISDTKLVAKKINMYIKKQFASQECIDYNSWFTD